MWGSINEVAYAIIHMLKNQRGVESERRKGEISVATEGPFWGGIKREELLHTALPNPIRVRRGKDGLDHAESAADT